MKDERIEQAKNKIRSEMAIITLYGVAISFLVKTLIFNMGLQECITEYLILIFFPLYQLIRMNTMKISIYSKRGDKQSVKNLVITIAVVLFASAGLIFKTMKNSSAYEWQNAVLPLLTFVLLFVVIFFMANKYNRYKGHKYEEEFDDDK